MVVSHDDPRLDRVGFAKLQGEGIEVYAKKYEVIIGRRSKNTNLDIILGDNMNVSRQHAKIVYSPARGDMVILDACSCEACFSYRVTMKNFQCAGVWELHVLGKNGVTVHGTLHTPSSPPVVLRSQDNIQIADRSFYFLLPSEPQWCVLRHLLHPSTLQRTNTCSCPHALDAVRAGVLRA